MSHTKTLRDTIAEIEGMRVASRTRYGYVKRLVKFESWPCQEHPELLDEDSTHADISRLTLPVFEEFIMNLETRNGAKSSYSGLSSYRSALSFAFTEQKFKMPEQFGKG